MPIPSRCCASPSPRRRLSAQDLTKLVQDTVEDRLLAAPGVADVQIFGDRDLVFRVDIDQLQLASRGLTLADLREALGDVSFDAPAGSLSSDQQSILVRTTASVTTAEQFEALDIAPNVQLGDVARVTLGPEPGASVLRANGETGIGLGIIRQAQSNTLEISDAVRQVIAEVQPILPPDVAHVHHLGHGDLHQGRDPRGRDRAGPVGRDRDRHHLPVPARLRAPR